MSDEDYSEGGYTEVISWGNDSHGQLGHGKEGKDRPVEITTLKVISFDLLISSVACGR